MTNLILGRVKNGWHDISDVQAITAIGLPIGTRQYIKGKLQLLFSPIENHPDGLWKHASISHPLRYPDWNEILDVRYTFFDTNNDVFQVLPPKSEYVNFHPNCFHLWSPIGRRLTPG